MTNSRPDHDGAHRRQFDINKKRIYASQELCGICGQPVDKSLKFPHPLAPTIDHIIPVSLGGHPSAINNLQLAHWYCNRQKSNKLIKENTPTPEENKNVGNRNLPQSMDWTKYKGG